VIARQAHRNGFYLKEMVGEALVVRSFFKIPDYSGNIGIVLVFGLLDAAYSDGIPLVKEDLVDTACQILLGHDWAPMMSQTGFGFD
jgi:hypothetical protein